MARRSSDHVLAARQRAAQLVRERAERLEVRVADAHVARAEYEHALAAAEVAKAQLQQRLAAVLELPGMTPAEAAALCEVDESELHALRPSRARARRSPATAAALAGGEPGTGAATGEAVA